MSKIEILGFEAIDSMTEIVNQWLEVDENRPLMNWNHDKILSSLTNARVIGSIDNKGALMAFLIYQDLRQSADIHLIISRISRVRSGEGGALIEYLKERFALITLDVHENNEKAINFYRKQGFKIDGRRPNYYLGGAAALLLSWNKD